MRTFVLILGSVCVSAGAMALYGCGSDSPDGCGPNEELVDVSGSSASLTSDDSSTPSDESPSSSTSDRPSEVPLTGRDGSAPAVPLTGRDTPASAYGGAGGESSGGSGGSGESQTSSPKSAPTRVCRPKKNPGNGGSSATGGGGGSDRLGTDGGSAGASSSDASGGTGGNAGNAATAGSAGAAGVGTAPSPGTAQEAFYPNNARCQSCLQAMTATIRYKDGNGQRQETDCSQVLGACNGAACTAPLACVTKNYPSLNAISSSDGNYDFSTTCPDLERRLDSSNVAACAISSCLAECSTD